MRTSKKLILLALSLWFYLPMLRAQNYSIEWDVIAGGGGMATGGAYSVNSTVGEHVAGGSLLGGPYSLGSGFWTLYDVTTTTQGTPALTIFLTDTNALLFTWPASSGSWTLQQNTGLDSGNWTSLTSTIIIVSGQNQAIIPAPTGNRFYRLQSP